MTHQQLTEKVNQNTVTIMSGNPNGGFLGMAYDISAVLDDGDEMRVLPIVGKGGAQNVRDVLYLKGVDMGITQANTMTYFKKTGEFPNIENRVVYVTTLFQDEMHIVAAEGPINTIKDLNGKRVNFSDAGSGTQLTVKLVFEALGINAQEFNMGQADALEKIKKGELDATICVCSKPLKPFKEAKQTGLKFITVPYEDQLLSDYAPITLSSEDYPNLIPPGQKVETIALTSVLAAYNWDKNTDRYRKVAQFIEAFFPKIEEFYKPPRNPKWKSVNLNATLPGWKRFPAAQQWLDKTLQSQAQARSTTTASAAIDPELAKEQAARAAPANPIEQERLFQKFMEWAKKQPQQ